MRIEEIEKTATFTWAPFQQKNSLFLCLGSVSGALDASFSSKSDLEIYALDLAQEEHQPSKLVGNVSTNARFHKVSWSSYVTRDRPMGIIAGGLEDGSLDVWNPQTLMSGGKDSLVLHHQTHHGPVRALDFNPIQPNLLASGASQAEIFVWDMNRPETPYTPGQGSSRLEDISCLAWNKERQNILACSSLNGACSIWDLKAKKEIIHLVPPTRKPITSIAWNPENPTQLLTAVDDETNPLIYMWDLKFAHAPEKSLSGHSRGVLAISWCSKDSNLLLSCGKDNRTLCWDPHSGEVIGEFPQARNWVFDVQWCPKNPDLLATASFDGKISIYSIQSKAETKQAEPLSPLNDPFATASSTVDSFTLKHPPKWLKRPCGAVFGISNQLVAFNATSKMISIKQANVSKSFSERMLKLEKALKEKEWKQFCSFKKQHSPDHKIWEWFEILFESDSRKRIQNHLGFSRETFELELQKKIQKSTKQEPNGVDSSQNIVKEVVNDVIDQAIPTDSLFDSAPQDDFLANIQQPAAHHSHPLSQSTTRQETEPEQLWPQFTFNSSKEADEWIKKSLVMADFKAAAQIAVSEGRLQDALIFGTFGGEQLLQQTMTVVLEKRSHPESQKSGTIEIPDYLPIVSALHQQDLTQLFSQRQKNESWKTLLSLICSFANEQEVSSYTRQLGESLMRNHSAESEEAIQICFLVSGDLEKLTQVWKKSFLSATAAADQDKICEFVERICVFQNLLHQAPTNGYTLSASLIDPNILNQFHLQLLQHGWLVRVYQHLSHHQFQENAHFVNQDWLYRLYHSIPAQQVSQFSQVPNQPFTQVAVHAPAVAPAVPEKKTPVVSAGQNNYAPNSTTSNYSAGSSYQQQGYSQQGGYGNYGTTSNYYQQPPTTTGQTSGYYQPQPVAPTSQQPNNYQQPTNTYQPPAASTGYSGYQQQPQASAPSNYYQSSQSAGYYQSPPAAASTMPPPPPKSFVPPPPNVLGQQQQQGQPPSPHQPTPPQQNLPPPQFMPGPHQKAVGGFNDPPSNIFKPPKPAAPIQQTYQQPAVQQPSSQQSMMPPPTSTGFQQPPPTQQPVPRRQSSTSATSSGYPQPPQQPGYPQPPQQSGYPQQQQQVPQSPVKPVYPVGDRSHIQPEHRPIYEVLSRLSNQLKPVVLPQQRKILEDADKRLQLLFDKLNNQDIGQSAIQELLKFSAMVEKKDWQQALQTQQVLMTNYSQEGTQFILGLKRLVEVARNVAQ